MSEDIFALVRNYKKKDQWQKKSSWQRGMTYRQGEDAEPKAPPRQEKPSDKRDVYREKAKEPTPKVVF